MSDEEVQTKKGRKVAAESTKRPKKEAKSSEPKDDGDAPPVKRGRGRPKGSIKKKTDTKPKANGVGRRGRSKKDQEEKEDTTEEEENGEKSSANEEEDEEDD
ncbi:hypothetical protein NQ315_006920 [Exocentrus adspersus]|uniref:Uncharacterized protein n=1 Tax=Exocentrus adspersus TaxID=1586481 RepID=A0AAV8WC21_9CUCU|nr:hypothetical protein NQ315_006920 [Exocentrus adspersus]